MSVEEIVESGNFDKMGGLVPAVVQDAVTGMVRMVGFMNREALSLTLRTGLVHFYSRTMKRIWMKGETSGNVLRVVEVVLDCDRDAVLVKADPVGPTCHTGRVSCFFNVVLSRRGSMLRELVKGAFSKAVIQKRKCFRKECGDHYLYVVNPFTDNIPPPSPLLVSLVVDEMLEQVSGLEFDKVVVPEALGLPFGSVFAYRAGRPLAVIRKRRYGLPGEIGVSYASGYEVGMYYIYGVERGEKVVLVDDAVSTGGTLVSTIKALGEAGVEVVGALAVISKPQYGGEEKVLEETGVPVKSVLKVYVWDDGTLAVEKWDGSWSFRLKVPVMEVELGDDEGRKL